MLSKLFRRRASSNLIGRLHGDIVAAVRQPTLYLNYGATDTFDGRFEILVLMATAAARRIAALPVPGPRIAQELVDSVFSHLEIAMREMGVSDIAVPKRMKARAGEFAGRSRVYGEALDAGDEAALAEAISRNVFGGRLPDAAPQVVRLARYTLAADRAFSTLDVAQLGAAPLPFPAALDTPVPTGESL